MRRRRSRNRSDSVPSSGLFGKLPGLVLLMALALPAAEWGADLLLQRLAAAQNGKAVAYSDKELAKAYGSDEPGRYHQVLAERRELNDSVYAPFVEYRMAPFQGRYVSVGEDGMRGGVTPQQSGPVVALFGGESLFGGALADDETIPARIAALFQERGIGVRLHNFSAVGWYSSQSRIAFAQMLATGAKPDVAVFMDGMSDFLQCGAPETSRWSGRLAGAAQPDGLAAVVRQSALARLARRLTGAADPDSLNARPDPACAADAQVEASLQRLDANRRMIAAMAERFGVKVLFVQEPVSVFHYDNAKRPAPIEPVKMEPYIPVAKGYARLAEMRGSGKLWEQDLLWLAELEPENGPAYVGAADYAPASAALIGRKIAAKLIDMAAPAPALGLDPAALPPAASAVQ